MVQKVIRKGNQQMVNNMSAMTQKSFMCDARKFLISYIKRQR